MLAVVDPEAPMLPYSRTHGVGGCIDGVGVVVSVSEGNAEMPQRWRTPQPPLALAAASPGLSEAEHREEPLIAELEAVVERSETEEACHMQLPQPAHTSIISLAI